MTRKTGYIINTDTTPKPNHEFLPGQVYFYKGGADTQFFLTRIKERHGNMLTHDFIPSEWEARDRHNHIRELSPFVNGGERIAREAIKKLTENGMGTEEWTSVLDEHVETSRPLPAANGKIAIARIEIDRYEGTPTTFKGRSYAEADAFLNQQALSCMADMGVDKCDVRLTWQDGEVGMFNFGLRSGMHDQTDIIGRDIHNMWLRYSGLVTPFHLARHLETWIKQIEPYREDSLNSLNQYALRDAE